MWRAYLSTSHLLFYNSPWKRGSLEVQLNTGLMTSTEGIWRTLENGRQLFKQRLLLFVLVTILVFNTFVLQSVIMWTHSRSKQASAPSPILFIKPIVRLEVSILFDRMHHSKLERTLWGWQYLTAEKNLSYKVDPINEAQAGAGNGLHASCLKDTHY